LLALGVSFVFVCYHLIGWYGNSRGKGPPISLSRVAVEFVFLFPSLFIAFLVINWLRAARARHLTHVVICPECKRISNLNDPKHCNCELEREDLTDWVWVRGHKDNPDAETAIPLH
jgi:hypothetical protein